MAVDNQSERKQLVILRHAKTEKLHPDGDHARALTSRGQRNAIEAGERIKEIVGIPDAILTSDAVRAVQTSEAVAAAAGFAGTLDTRPEIYASSLDTLVRIIHNLDVALNKVVLIGHNPEFLQFIHWCGAGGAEYEQLPTSGFAVVQIPGLRWSDVNQGVCEVSAIYRPTRAGKQLRDGQ